MATEPETPQIEIPHTSNLRSRGPGQIIVSGAVMEFACRHFSQAVQLQSPILRRQAEETGVYLYQPSRSSTGIVIGMRGDWSPKVTQTTPAIIFRRNDVEAELLGVDGRLHGGHTEDMFDHFSAITMGSINVFCIDKSDGAAEILAEEVFLLYLQFASLIRESLGLVRFRATKIGAAFILGDESAENVVVPITLTYAANITWHLRPHVPLLRHIDINVDFR